MWGYLFVCLLFLNRNIFYSNSGKEILSGYFSTTCGSLQREFEMNKQPRDLQTGLLFVQDGKNSIDHLN